MAKTIKVSNNNPKFATAYFIHSVPVAQLTKNSE
jgi:hypothetical protein